MWHAEGADERNATVMNQVHKKIVGAWSAW
jgi:hypothetical protein